MLKIKIILASLLSLSLLLSGCASSSSSTNRAGKVEQATKTKIKRISKKNSRKSNVYVMRGLANVFSLGMDRIAKKVNAKGIHAEVYNHASSNAVVNKIIANKRAGNKGRVILIGHSLGANVIVDMARKLKAHKIRVDLLVAFDPTVKKSIPSNVRRSVNYYRKGTGWGTSLKMANGARGKFKNVELSKRGDIDHFNIDESKFLHKKVLRMVVRTVGRYK